MTSDKEFEMLLVAFERNTGTGSLKSANATLVKMLRLMWEQINTPASDPEPSEVLFGAYRDQPSLPLFERIDDATVVDVPVQITIAPDEPSLDELETKLADLVTAFNDLPEAENTMPPLAIDPAIVDEPPVPDEAKVEELPEAEATPSSDEAMSVPVAATTESVEVPALNEDEAGVIAAIEAAGPKRKRTKA